MKKLLCFLLIIGFIFCSFPSHAFSVVSSGSVSQANMRLSIVNGTAFVDFTSAGALTPYIGHKLIITDSASKTLTGYIKAVGTGETLATTGGPLNDGNLVTNGGFGSDTASWTAGNSATLTSETGGQSGNGLDITKADSGTSGYAYQSITTLSGALYVLNFYHKNGTHQGNVRIGIVANGDTIYSGGALNDADWANYTPKGTASGTTTVISLKISSTSTNQNTHFDTVLLNQVLTPSATGVTITVTPNGATYNWESETSGFNRNDSSGYTYAIYRISRGNIMYFD